MSRFSKFEDLIKAVSKLPSTIEYLKVPISFNTLGGSEVKIYWSENLAEEVKELMESGILSSKYYLESISEDKKCVIDEYYLSSYCGNSHPETDAYYIHYKNVYMRNFGEAMRNGDFGPLD